MSDASAKSRRHSYFLVKEPGAADRILILDTQELTIGRSDDSDLQAKYPEVSRRQAVLKRDGQQFSVQNLSTSSSPLVNGSATQHQVLKNGDVIRVSELEITFVETTDNPATVGPKLEYVSQLKEFAPAGVQGDNPEATILGVAPSSDETDGGDFSVGRAGDFGYGLDANDDESAVPRDLDRELDDFGLHDPSPEPIEMTPEALAPTAKPAVEAPKAATAQPDAAKSSRTAPVGAKPAKTDPAKAKPAGTKPAGTQPAKTGPAKTKPAQTGPAKTKPAGTQPASTNAPQSEPVARDEAWTLDDGDSTPDASSPTLSVNVEIEGLTPDLQKIVHSMIGKVISLPTLKIRLKGKDLG